LKIKNKKVEKQASKPAGIDQEPKPLTKAVQQPQEPQEPPSSMFRPSFQSYGTRKSSARMQQTQVLKPILHYNQNQQNQSQVVLSPVSKFHGPTLNESKDSKA
jgi:hypothetical protein